MFHGGTRRQEKKSIFNYIWMRGDTMEIVLDEDIGKIISMKFNLTKKPSMTESFLKNGTLTTIQAKHLLSEIEKIYDVRFTSMDGLESPAKIAEWVNNVNGLNNYTVRKMFLEICGNHAGEKAVVFDGEALTYDLFVFGN